MNTLLKSTHPLEWTEYLASHFSDDGAENDG
jgi:hypothetical protein